jgi:flagellar biosynthesis GTPase FlhF
MSAQAQAQDYWPGFLDILVNVMLYLLLLVSSFALGSVALTLHSMQQQFQLSELDVGQAVEMQSAELNEEDRRRLMLRLESLDVQAMLKRREEVDRERQLLEARRKEVERELAQQQRTAQEVRQRNRSRPDREAVQQEEVRLQQQRSDYEFTLSALGVELSTMRRNLAQASESLLLQKQSQQAKAEQVESDFRVSSVLGSVGIGEDLQVIVERRLGRSVVTV